MSWDASLNVTVDGNEFCVPGADWNHTHNCNRMIYAIMDDLGIDTKESWWKQIHERPAADCRFLSDVIARLEADPARFIAMNPSNEWGSYDTLLRVLREMRDYGLRFPSATWRVHG